MSNRIQNRKYSRFARSLLKSLAVGAIGFSTTFAQDNSTLTSSALRIAQQHFASVRLNVGDSWFVQFVIPPQQGQSGYLQMKAVSFQVIQTQVSYTDGLNGIQWKGGVDFRAKAVRTYTRGAGWSAWLPSGSIYRCLLECKNGQWSATDAEESDLAVYGPNVTLSKPNVNELPPL